MSARIKFIWGRSQAIGGRWHLGLFGFYRRRTGGREWLAVSMRGAMSWLVALAISGYVGGAGVLYWIWDRNPYSILSFGDAVLYPLRRDVIADKKGRAFIAQGEDYLRVRNWRDGIHYLEYGLARSPRNLAARLTLARLYRESNRHPAARRLLQQGLGDDYPGRDYLHATFTAAEEAEDWGTIVEIAARYEKLPVLAGHPNERRWLRQRQFEALMSSEQYQAALAGADAEPIGDTASEHRVMALLALGRTGEASTAMRDWRSRKSLDPALAARLQARVMRESCQFLEMERALAEWRAFAPTAPEPYIETVVQETLAGRNAQRSQAFEDFILRFGGDRPSVVRLAIALASIDALPVVRCCVAAAADRGHDLQPLHPVMAEQLMRRGEWAEAGMWIRGTKPSGAQAPTIARWRDWMDRLVEAACSPAQPAQAALVEILRGPWSILVFRRTVEVLTRAERWETAKDVIRAGLVNFPDNAWLKAQLVSVAAKAVQKAQPAVSVR